MRYPRVLAAAAVCAFLAVPAIPAEVPAKTWWQPPERPVAKPRRPAYPGFGVRYKATGPRLIQSQATSVAAFVGATSRGPFDSPVRVTSFNDYTRHFGGTSTASPVSYAVRLFFDNGGGDAWIVRTDPAALPGGAATASGIYALETAEPLNILCIPEISDQAVLAAAEEYCRRRRAFLIIDPPVTANSPAAVSAWLKGHHSPPRTANCATYFPWLQVRTSAGSQTVRDCGPSGAVAGTYARTDAARGVWKAPAGLQTDLRGVTRPAYALSNTETSQLNQMGINPIREMPQVGTVIWGARTLSADPEWRYVPVRRLALMIEESIDAGTEWVVFEPNTEQTWQTVRLVVDTYMNGLWRDGALRGTKPEEAYFVRCDGTTTTAADIAAGRMHILIGFAPTKPAEFIVMRVSKQIKTP